MPFSAGVMQAMTMSARRVVLVLEQLHRALAACAYGVQGRVPAEIRQVEPEAEARLQEVLARLCLVWFFIYIDRRHSYVPRCLYGHLFSSM